MWRCPDERLQALLDKLQKASGTEARIDVAVLLEGPLDADVAALQGMVAESSKAANFVLSSIWYLGNGSHANPVFDLSARNDAVRRLVRVILSEDDEFAVKLGLFRGQDLIDARRIDYAIEQTAEADLADATQRHIKDNVFSTFGLMSWEPWPEEFDAGFVRRIAGSVLHCEQQDRAADMPGIRKNMTDAADTLLVTLASLATPYDQNTRGKSIQSFTEQLPLPPVFTLAAEGRSFSREQLEPILSQALGSGYERALREYRATLMAALPEISQQIRRNGRRVFVQGLDAFRALVRATDDLPAMGSLLNDFFPRLMKARSVAALTPAKPASDPHASICRVCSVNAKALLATACEAMPSENSIRLLRWVCGLLAFTPALMFLFHVTWPLVWIPVPAACGGVLVWAAGASCRRTARRIIDGLTQRFREDAETLRSLYVIKLEWILQKTQCAVENQVVGEVSSIGRKLELNYNHFYATGIAAETEMAATSRIVEMMTARGVPIDVADRCRQQIKAAVNRLIEDALKEGAPSVGRIVAQDLLDQLVLTLTVSAVVPRPPQATVESEIRKAAAWKDQPPIHAVLPAGEDSSHFARYYLLPDAYYDKATLRSGLPTVGGHNIRSSVLQAHSLHEPVMISLRTDLTAEEVAASLAVAGED